MIDRRSGDGLRATLLVLLMLSCYNAVPLVSGGRLLVPSFPTFLLLPAVVWFVWPWLSKQDETFVPKLAFLFVLSIALSPGYEHVQEKFLGMSQVCVAAFMAVLIVRLMQSMQPTNLESALLFLWVLIVLGSALEVLGPLRGLSDEFRERAFVLYDNLYDSDLRDVSLVGWVRPKLFTSEPSHVTKGFIGFVNAWLLVRFTWRKMLITLVATGVMLVIMGSPMIVASAVITVVVALASEASALARFAVLVVFLLSVAAGLMLVPEEALSALTERLREIWQGSGGYEISSSNQRIVFPYLTLIDTWLNWPLFGVGISGKEVVAELTKLPVVPPVLALGNNVMAEVGIYLGVFGSFFFLYLVSRQVRHWGIRRLGLMCLIVVCFSQLMGGLESVRYWGYLGLFWGAMVVADTRRATSRPGHEYGRHVPFSGVRNGEGTAGSGAVVSRAKESAIG